MKPYLFHLSVANKREPEDEQLCIAVHKTYTYLNAVKSPLDTSERNNSSTLPYITWGLVWDSRIKETKESQQH